MDDLQVIAEPRRRQILAMIWDQEMAASSIAAEFDVTFGAVSQHLSVLRRAGMVDVRAEGNHRYYRANQDRLAPYRAILETMWQDTLGDLKAVIEGKPGKQT